MSQIVWLPEVDSTNTCLREMATQGAPAGTVVAAEAQTAGRGQRGNSWEAEAGKNLTFSVLLRPGRLPAAEQFVVSMSVSLAIVRTLRHHLPTTADVRVKWPNDIYVGDKKICGILIENSLQGTQIGFSVVGVGLNVNQIRFLSDAPNPVSMAQVAGKEFTLRPLLEEVAEEIEAEMARQESADAHDALLAEYRRSLWRGEGFHPYRLPDGEEFSARIAQVGPTGMLTLEREDGTSQTFAFKEVAAVIPAK